jgi:hypothetical protein
MTHHSSFQNKVLPIVFDFYINEFRCEVFCRYHPYEPGSTIGKAPRHTHANNKKSILRRFYSTQLGQKPRKASPAQFQRNQATTILCSDLEIS